MDEKIQIENVYIRTLNFIENEKGGLLLIQRNDDKQFPGYGQTYITKTHPKIIKAWYRHHKQIDEITILQGKAKLVLFDSREASKTFGKIQEIILDAKQPVIVQIPTLIWHGFQAVSNEILVLLHINSELFDQEHLDEDRLEINNNFIPYAW